MTSTLNWSSQSSSEAALVFDATLQHPAVTIPLYVTEYVVPTRNQKYQDVSTIDSFIDAPAGFRAGFFAAQESLQVAMSGFFITPLTNNVWNPTTDGLATGTSLNLQGTSYPELVLAYMEGRMERTPTGRFVRKDPSQFVDPYGNVYSSPYIMVFESSFTVTPKKQTFSMTLRLGA